MLCLHFVQLPIIEGRCDRTYPGVWNTRRFHPVRVDAAGRRIIPSPHASVALTGLAAITVYKLIFTGFKYGTGLGVSAGTWRMNGSR